MEQKHIRMRLSQQHLERFKKDKVDFVRRFSTMDETWVYQHDPESKQEAKELCEPGCSASKRVRFRKSTKKIMASVFRDAKEILFVDYLQAGKTINFEYYCNIFDQLKEKNSWKKTRFAEEKNPFSSGQCTVSQKHFHNG